MTDFQQANPDRTDPRARNDRIRSSNIGDFLSQYATRLSSALASVDATALAKAHHVIVDAAAKGRRIYAIGNGGSSAIADHLCCDWTKGTHAPGHPTIESVSLGSNVAMYSAIANDFGFENVFSAQIEFVGKPGDVLIAISSSGNSINILSALSAAHKIGMSTIGMSGFTGGGLRQSAEIALHVDVKNYGLVEDAHQAIMHVLAQYIFSHRQS